jgi:hypothetical protein
MSQRDHVTTGKASLIGGFVVAVATMVLWWAVTRELGFYGTPTLLAGAGVATLAGVWTRLADL